MTRIASSSGRAAAIRARRVSRKLIRLTNVKSKAQKPNAKVDPGEDDENVIDAIRSPARERREVYVGTFSLSSRSGLHYNRKRNSSRNSSPAFLQRRFCVCQRTAGDVNSRASRRIKLVIRVVELGSSAAGPLV